MPADAEGVWTISARSMSRGVVDARKDRTLHIDQYSGTVLANIGWNEYAPGAKAMAAGIALHMGAMGWWLSSASPSRSPAQRRWPWCWCTSC
jgi:uncharacterized iron-regulated membrane protein